MLLYRNQALWNLTGIMSWEKNSPAGARDNRECKAMVVQNCLRGKIHPEIVECNKPKDWEESADLRECFSCHWLLIGQQWGLYIIQEQWKTQQKGFLGKCHLSAATSTGLLFLLLPHHQLQMQTPLIPQGYETHHPRAASTACPHLLGAFHWHTGALHWSRILYQGRALIVWPPFYGLLTARFQKGDLEHWWSSPLFPHWSPWLCHKKLLVLSKKSSSVVLNVPTGSRLALGFFVKR